MSRTLKYILLCLALLINMNQTNGCGHLEVCKIKLSLDTHEYNLNYKTTAQTAGNKNHYSISFCTRMGKNKLTYLFSEGFT